MVAKFHSSVSAPTLAKEKEKENKKEIKKDVLIITHDASKS